MIPEIEEEIKITVDVFWKQKNVYLLANVQDKEEVVVTVNSGTKTIVAQESFYTTTGIIFNAAPKHTYRLRVNNHGNIEKLLFMRVSQAIKAPDTAAKKSGIETT